MNDEVNIDRADFLESERRRHFVAVLQLLFRVDEHHVKLLGFESDGRARLQDKPIHWPHTGHSVVDYGPVNFRARGDG